MGKQLKKVEYDAETEAKFRETLKVASVKAIKTKPTFDTSDLPANCVDKIINFPSEFVSKLKSDDPTKLKVEFVKFIYGKFKVPRLLDKAWTISNVTNDERFNNRYGYNRNDNRPATINRIAQYDFKAWWVCIASGGSLYKDHCKNFLTKKEVHTFINCPHDISLNEAITYSVAVCYDASIGDALRISKSNLQNKSMGGNHGKFWRDVIHFFAMNPPDSVKAIDDLLDYLGHKYNENNTYTVLGQGFTLESLHKKMKDWHYELGRIKVMGDASWEGHGIDDSEFETKDVNDNNKIIIWTMTQIKTARALAEEGNLMRHCVYGYKEQCKRGYSSIWSLKSSRKSGEVKRHLTIELNNHGNIVQARGLANRSPKQDEMNIVTKWCQKEQLYYTGR